ncbi:type I secretion system permease/ATPase [Pseudovibrio sp. Alg231-02]|uniref:type I secretion system permease/ATPase n=1 Tax=Pseudovibrio sp. Alg231-02 TaxID=1922223 RepID=UPI000D56198E|nr:type I secretion system permease/ATPase [Pseudovibrio sp. Alg231-02]
MQDLASTYQPTQTEKPQPASPGNRDIDTGIACLVTLFRFHGLPTDAEQLVHQFGRSGLKFTAEDLLRATKRLNLKSRVIESNWERLASTSFPVISETGGGNFFIIAKVDSQKETLLIQDPAQGRVQQISRQELEARWTGRLLLATKRAQLFGEGSKFDISWFVPALMRYKRLFGEVLVASFFLQLMALISPLFFQVVVDKVLVHRGLTTLDVLIIGLVTVSIFEVLLGGLRTYTFSHTTNRVDVELGVKLFRHLLNLPLSYFESRAVGQNVARVRELDSIRNFITGSALTLLIDLGFTIVFFCVMFYFSPLLTSIVLGSIPFYVMIALIITPILRRRMEEQFQRGAENQAFLVESITGVETLKSMAVEPQTQRKWEELLSAYVGASFRASNLGNIAGQLTQFVNKVTMALTLYFGALAVVHGDMTVGQLVAFNMLSGRVSGPILKLSQLWNDFQQARISVAKLGDILNTPAEPSYNPNRSTLKQISGRIELDSVNFRYRPDGQEILRDLNLKIPAGQVVGIVGPSGSGKSTITKLVQRMYVPERGRIMVDGTDLAMVDTSWLRRQVGVVLQENLLFNRSIRENISLADPGLPMEQVVKAAKLAGAHSFIQDLKEGYDTMVVERGANLSGGQRQRIAIARALLTNPRILILDEATSALDYESERVIQENMRKICHGRTVLIIAHRLATVRDADRIITIEEGRLVEDGTHKELLQRKGRYSALYQLQGGSEE